MPARPVDSGSKCAGPDDGGRFVISSSSFLPETAKTVHPRVVGRRFAASPLARCHWLVSVSRDLAAPMSSGRISGPNAMAEAYEIIDHGYDSGGRT
jgi:hypothetical protein